MEMKRRAVHHFQDCFSTTIPGSDE